MHPQPAATHTRLPAIATDVVDLSVSRYDRICGMLVSLILLVGVAVLWMFMNWLTTVFAARPDSSHRGSVEIKAGRDDHAAGQQRDVEPPGAEELDELNAPQLDNLLEKVTDVVTAQASALDRMTMNSTASSRGRGLGDDRPPGPRNIGPDVVPRWQRWQVQYDTTDLAAYAAQLDYFGIELAAIGGGRSVVDYAYHLTKSPPDWRSGPGEAETRLYMTWTSGRLAVFDRRLLLRAGIPITGRITVQCYPPVVEDQLARLELEAASGFHHDELTPEQTTHFQEQLARTVFGVRRLGEGYQYYVIRQTLRGDD